MRTEIKQLEQLGPLPAESEAGVEQLKGYEQLLNSITKPISDEEARVLVKLFGLNHDSCFGVAWTLIHLIETAPGWPLRECLENTNNEWVTMLRDKAFRGGIL